MTLKDLEQLKELVGVAKILKPILSESADELIDAYGPELNKIVTKIRIAVVNETHEAISQYVDLGYTKEEAILLVLNSKNALVNALNSYKK